MSFNETVLDSWTALQQAPVTVQAATALGVGILITLAYPALFSSKKSTGITELGGWSILTAWPFFNKRFDFLRENFAKTGENFFTFKVLHHSVTAMKGPEARKAFFDNKYFGFSEGYEILMGAAPRLKDIKEPEEHQEISWFNKQLSLLLNKQRLSEVLPSLFDDVQARMDGWGKEGRMDPFKNIYDLVFQMTVRMATCRDLASDKEALDKLQHDYWVLEKSATPTALLLPWFPSKAKKDKETSTRNLFTQLYGYVEQRRAAEVPSADAIDLLIAEGLGNHEIISFILGTIFAGVVNTGINSCWALLFLSFNKEWKAKVTAEVHALIQTHTDTSSSTSAEPLHKRLSAIPISVWEDEMPIMDLVIRETLRLVLNGTVLRRNLAADVALAGTGKVLPRGNFVAFPLSDVHLNPEIYADPAAWDPTRFMPGREEDRKVPFGYLGWGAGRHPCTGMKVAKLEMKIIVALFLAGYEFDVVDAAGRFPERLPTPDYNDIQQARPVGPPTFIKFKRVVE
ncbi:putative cytochrome P450 [Lyophyllum shimeji]|uniref:Cytochrome P450 n=1 Tax=Lyophyllum shimeji TaxID=47721 RepID=A0A9P3UP78_LYOSH|nr:putative cytochrome P450 [Lyophyllum shimeji]